MTLISTLRRSQSDLQVYVSQIQLRVQIYKQLCIFEDILSGLAIFIGYNVYIVDYYPPSIRYDINDLLCNHYSNSSDSEK